MKKFTKLWLMTMTLLFSVSVFVSQAQNVKTSKQNDSQVREVKVPNFSTQYQPSSIFVQELDMLEVEKLEQQKNEASALPQGVSTFKSGNEKVATLKDVLLEKVKQEKQMKASLTTEMSPKAGSPVPPSDFLFDVQFDWPLTHPDGVAVGIETDGDYIYLCHWQNGNFYRYNMAGTYLATFTITGVANIRDMAYNPNNGFFYGSAANTTVWEMDFTPGAEALVSTIIAPTAIRAIGFDDNNNLLFGNNWSTAITFFNLSGVFQYSFPVGPTGASYYGLAYDDYSTGGPFVWGYAQIGVSLEWLIQMNAATGVETGMAYDVGTALGHAVGNLAGGLAITPPGTFTGVDPLEWSIFGIAQNESMWAVELGAPNPCPMPVSLNANNIMDTQADLGWTETGASIIWDIEIQPLAVPFTGTPTHTGVGNPYTMMNLTTLTAYHWKVRADCGSGSYSGWSAPHTFTTTGGDCMWEVVGYDSWGDGWNGGSIDFYVNGGFVGNWAGPLTFGPESYFFPILDPSTINIVWNAGTYDSEVTYEIYDNFGGLQFSDGPNPTGTTGLAGGCTPPACPDPTPLAMTNVTNSGATANWTENGTATQWYVEYGPLGFAQGTGTLVGPVVDANPLTPGIQYNFTGMAAGQIRSWYVQAFCNPETSNWKAGPSFQTTAPIPAGDDCATPIVVTGIYPTTVSATTKGATPSCPTLFPTSTMPSGEVWLEIDLPYANNTVVIDIAGTVWNNGWIGGSLIQCSCIGTDYINATTWGFNPPNLTDLTWPSVPGPGKFYYPLASGTWQDDLSVTVDVTEFFIPQGASCADPITVTLPAQSPYTDAGQTTCGMGNNYTETCLGSYDGGEDIIYEITLTSDALVTVLLDPLGTTWTGILLDNACPAGLSCIATSTMGGSTPHGFSVPLTAGTYYLMIDTWPSPNCIPSFDLTITTGMAYDIDGTVTYFGNGTPMNYTTVTLDDGSTIIATTPTNSSGYFQFTGIPDGTYTLGASTLLQGGVDNNATTVGDINLIINHILGAPLVGLQFLASDLNLDNSVDVNDINLMINNILGVLNPGWIAPDWIFENPGFTLSSDLTVNFKAISSGDPDGSYIPLAPPAQLVCETAQSIDISTLPTSVTGNTAGGLIWSSLPVCGTSITAPGKWFTFTGTGAELVVDLCTNTTWDTKLHIFSGDCNTLVCVGGNDDYCGFQSGLQFVSAAGVDYFVLVNGFSANTGPFELTVSEVPPCTVTCPPGSTAEGEAPIPDEGADVTNGGCNSTPNVFGSVACGETICGTAGFYMLGVDEYRDTDWYELDLTGASGPQNVTVTFEAEFLIQGYILSGDCVGGLNAVASYLAAPCEVGTMTAVSLSPGIYYIFMAPDFTATANWDDYHFTVTCVDTPAGTYCPATTLYFDEYISGVVCGSINNTGTSWQGGVANYTSQNTTIAAGNSEAITVIIGGYWSGDLVRVWVDWNNNYTFDIGGNEEFILTLSGTNFIGNISVPAGTPSGTYRMRVRLTYSATPLPCGEASFGEVEDYSIVVP